MKNMLLPFYTLLKHIERTLKNNCFLCLSSFSPFCFRCSGAAALLEVWGLKTQVRRTLAVRS